VCPSVYQFVQTEISQQLFHRQPYNCVQTFSFFLINTTIRSKCSPVCKKWIGHIFGKDPIGPHRINYGNLVSVWRQINVNNLQAQMWSTQGVLNVQLKQARKLTFASAFTYSICSRKQSWNPQDEKSDFRARSVRWCTTSIPVLLLASFYLLAHQCFLNLFFTVSGQIQSPLCHKM